MKYLVIIITTIVMVSCGDKQECKYPTYELTKVLYVPDSLKEKQRKWITETVRAASNHMSGGDYEDVDKTIREAKRVSEDIFGVEEIGLLIHFNSYTFKRISPNEMNEKEKAILDNLLNHKLAVSP